MQFCIMATKDYFYLTFLNCLFGQSKIILFGMALSFFLSIIIVKECKLTVMQL